MTHMNKATDRGSFKILLAAIGLAALSLTACNDSSNGGPGPTDDYDSLHVPRSVLLDTGEVAFSICAGCHLTRGVGSPGFAPPLLHSDFLMAQRLRPVRIVLMGLPNVIDTQAVITVNALEYNGGDNPMPAVAIDEHWSNLRIAAVMTYIRAVLNDSTSTNCNPAVLDENQMATCTKTPRPVSEVETDSVAVWEVKALRDSLADAGLIQ